MGVIPRLNAPVSAAGGRAYLLVKFEGFWIVSHMICVAPIHYVTHCEEPQAQSTSKL